MGIQARRYEERRYVERLCLMVRKPHKKAVGKWPAPSAPAANAAY